MKTYLAFFLLAVLVSGCVTSAENKAPQISGIPGVNIMQGNSASFRLDDYVSDESSDSELTWTYSGNSHVSILVDSSRIATITAPGDWVGTEIVTFTVSDLSGLSSSTSVSVAVSSRITTLAVFSDGSEQELIEFAGAESKTASISIPSNVTITSATVTLTGESLQKTSHDSSRVYYGTNPSIYPFRAESSARTQMLYLGPGGNGIGKSGIIDSICLQKFENTSNIFYNINISLCETEKNAIFTDFSANCIKPVLVLSRGSLNITDGAHDWYCFDIDNVFEYNSAKNLIVEFIYTSANTSLSVRLKGANVPSTESRFVYSDNYTSSSGLTYPTIPNLNITFVSIASEYPSELIFDVSRTNVKTYSGIFNKTETVDITQALNSSLNDCSSGSCVIDFRLTSGSSGRIRLNNLVVEYK